MANDSQNFRSAVLGFDRNDVIDYLGNLSKLHHDEVEAYRAANDTLRKERDAAKAQVAALEAQSGQLANQQADQQQQLHGDRVALANMGEQLMAKRVLCDELSDRLHLLDGQLQALQTENADLKSRLLSAQAQADEMTLLKQQTDDLELIAYKRAEEIEAEAMLNAEKVRTMLHRLNRETKGKYAVARGEAEAVAFSVMTELGRIRDWFDVFPRLFDSVDEVLESLNSFDKTGAVRSFVPSSFDDSVAPPPETTPYSPALQNETPTSAPYTSVSLDETPTSAPYTPVSLDETPTSAPYSPVSLEETPTTAPYTPVLDETPTPAYTPVLHTESQPDIVYTPVTLDELFKPGATQPPLVERQPTLAETFAEMPPAVKTPTVKIPQFEVLSTTAETARASDLASMFADIEYVDTPEHSEPITETTFLPTEQPAERPAVDDRFEDYYEK